MNRAAQKKARLERAIIDATSKPTPDPAAPPAFPESITTTKRETDLLRALFSAPQGVSWGNSQVSTVHSLMKKLGIAPAEE